MRFGFSDLFLNEQNKYTVTSIITAFYFQDDIPLDGKYEDYYT